MLVRSNPSAGYPFGTFLLPGAVGAFQIYDSLSVEELPYTRAFFAVVVVLAIFVIIAHSAKVSLSRRAQKLVLGFFLLAPVYLLVGMSQPVWFLNYVVGDFAAVTLPLLLALAILAEPRLLSARALTTLGVALSIAAVAGYLLGPGSRSDPPAVFLIVLAWTVAIYPSKARWQWMGLFGAIFVGYLAYASGYRTHSVLWILAPVVISLMLRGKRFASLRSISAALLVAGVATLSPAFNPTDSLSNSRFSTLSASETDASLQVRVDEVQDVLDTASEQWLPGQALVGSGFGATYVPDRVYIESNANAEGTVHNVHVGPAMVFFRYGFVGLLVVTLLFLLCAKHLKAMARGRSSSPPPFVRAVVTMSCGFYLVDFLLRNSTVQPAMAFSVGATLYFWSLVPPVGQRKGRQIPESQGSRVSRPAHGQLGGAR